MAITIKDVARESGVNVSTVSRALNGEYGVHSDTRELVLAVAERLQYRPNRVARGLVTGRSHTLALVVSDIRNPFFAEVARGAEDAAYASDYDLVLCNSDLDAEKQLRYVESLMEKRVDGILMNSVAELSKKQVEQLSNVGVPIVLLNRAAPRNAFSTICADNDAGGVLAAEYLWKLGHRKIAHLTGPRHHGNMTERANGFVRALSEARKPVKPVVLHGKNNFQGGMELAQKLLAQHEDVTAIFAASDMMAFGAIRALMEAGKRIPEDVSVIGFDNVELSTIVNPPLTTIHQPKYEIGQAAVEILLRLAGRGEHQAPEHRVFGVHLIERRSCMERKS
ncbi:MAG: transcriptional regulator, LacI family [Candidatus Solibacter sp.]|jgi:DNA-binding LacI/PurR family transcriptional regulator|nr:transcriptional regulator, LacI family [Candidatus Solibacter sp.]